MGLLAAETSADSADTGVLARRRALGRLARRRAEPIRRRVPKRLWRYLVVVGPGLIVANAGNDAGGIFTYSNVGAKYGLSLLWTVVPTTIALVVTQEMVARLGCVTGKGLMDLIRERVGVAWTLFASIVVIVANGGTLLAEFAGAAGALGLLGVPRAPAVIGSALLIAVIVLRGNRPLVERVFLAMGLVFFSYIITAVLVHPDWHAVGRSFVVPDLSTHGVSTGAYVADVIALIGTSITPYMQLYLQSAIVDKGTPEADLAYVRADVISGSVFAEMVAAFIIITTASTLFLHGAAGVGVDSAESAAQALAPLAGVHAEQLFAVGLLGASLLAAGVLPLSTAFVVCEAFGAERSVERKFSEAPLFFTLFLGLLVVGAGIMLIPGISIAGVAIGTQTLDGILLPILLVFIVILANDRRLLGRRRNGPTYNVLAVSTVGILVLLTLFLLVSTLFPGLTT